MIRSKMMAESIGTYAVVFFGCGSIILADSIPAIMVPVIFGMIVATMIYTLGHISGAHFNPAVTLAFAATRHFPARQILPYWAAQITGGIAAIATLSFLIPDAGSYGATIPAAGSMAAFAWEVMLSFFLMFVIIAVATDTRAEGVMAGIAIGTIVTVCAFIGGPFSGASMNPARSIGPAFFQGTTDTLWIYISAPFIGALLGGFTYQKIRCEKHVSNAKGCC